MECMWSLTAAAFAAVVAGRWKSDVICGFDEAAAVDEFGVDRAGIGGADGKGEAGAGFTVVGGEGVVSDEEAVSDGDALFCEDSGERRDGAGLRPGLPGLAGFAGVDGEEDGRGGGVAGEVVSDGLCVGEFLARLVGEVDAESGSDAVVFHCDTHKAFLGPEAEGVPNEAEDILWCFDRELFHDPVSLTLAIAVFSAVVGCGRRSGRGPSAGGGAGVQLGGPAPGLKTSSRSHPTPVWEVFGSGVGA